MTDLDLVPYRQFAPTPFDCRGLRAEDMGHDSDNPDRSEWLVMPVSQTRDSGILASSNFDATIRSLDETGEDGYEIHRFGHWGPGWYELILIRPGSQCEAVARDIVAALSHYPVLDDEDMSARETEQAEERWGRMDTRERGEMVQRAQRRGAGSVSVFAARRDTPPPECFDMLRED